MAGDAESRFVRRERLSAAPRCLRVHLATLQRHRLRRRSEHSRRTPLVVAALQVGVKSQPATGYHVGVTSQLATE